MGLHRAQHPSKFLQAFVGELQEPTRVRAISAEADAALEAAQDDLDLLDLVGQ